MTSADRREQLVTVARSCFAEHGFDGTSIEEIASRAEVSKPVVYEHFAGKEGLYAVVVDREVHLLLSAIRGALQTHGAGSRRLLELGALAMLDYIESQPEGFQILMRDTSSAGGGSFGSILNDIIARVEGLLQPRFAAQQISPKAALLYAQALTGLVALTAQWWLDHPDLSKAEVASHLVNLAWNGLHHLELDFTVSPA